MKNETLTVFKAAAIALASTFLAVPAFAACTINGDGYNLDWDNVVWPSPGALSSSATVRRTGEAAGAGNDDPVTITMNVSGNTEGSQAGYPNVESFQTGGYGVTQKTLQFFSDYATSNDAITLTLLFSRPVDKLFIPVTDVDYLAPANGTGGYRDTVTVTASATQTGANTILPVVSTPYHAAGQTGMQSPSVVYLGNPLASNESTGNGQAASDSNVGNAFYTFSTPVQKVVLVYRNAFITTSNPAQQAMSIYDLQFCTDRGANLNATKAVKVLSENSTNCATITASGLAGAEAAIPGACLLYTITVRNTGKGTATAVTMSDVLNSRFRFITASQSGFGTGASLAVPASNQDCGTSACTVRLTNGSLAANATGTILVRTTVK